ncbi:hypothetical protein LY474_23540 [Myxococcus stipitatus]|uniref:hypothetical protein n=1 Tax=Myxococcus stipitatus TaxID=83455 RepID=UPI001F1C7198|nr:hypothetical protein [Myxococcus stipitatus]MCE9670785.1 hypothetical protein [Myxococcus stipitatus]
MGLKVSSLEGIVVWGIHANASAWGGKAAVKKAISSLKKERERLSLWGGDFNRGIAKAASDGARVCHPLAHDGSRLNFTQWNHEQRGSTGRGYSQKLHLPEGKALSFPVDPRGVIDYVIHGKGLEVTAEPNCPTVEMWCEILAQFDHCPVVYTVKKKAA